MLLLKILVHLVFFHFHVLSVLLFLELFAKFFTDQALSLLFAQKGLLLLFVVEKRVKFVDGSPFVLLV